MADPAPPEAPQRKKNQLRCTKCRADNGNCDHDTPCGRCKNLGVGEQCVYPDPNALKQPRCVKCRADNGNCDHDTPCGRCKNLGVGEQCEYPDPNAPKEKKKKKKKKGKQPPCVKCNADHKSCDRDTPCGRCKNLGVGEQCEYPDPNAPKEKKKKKKKNTQARCVKCRADNGNCDHDTPCGRCKRLGVGEQCEYPDPNAPKQPRCVKCSADDGPCDHATPCGRCKNLGVGEQCEYPDPNALKQPRCVKCTADHGRCDRDTPCGRCKNLGVGEQCEYPDPNAPKQPRCVKCTADNGRCDRDTPCGRCKELGVEEECEYPARKRKRSLGADVGCVRCQEAGKECDLKDPCCHCSNANEDCHYPDTSNSSRKRRRGARRGAEAERETAIGGVQVPKHTWDKALRDWKTEHERIVLRFDQAGTKIPSLADIRASNNLDAGWMPLTVSRPKVSSSAGTTRVRFNLRPLLGWLTPGVAGVLGAIHEKAFKAGAPTSGGVTPRAVTAKVTNAAYQASLLSTATFLDVWTTILLEISLIRDRAISEADLFRQTWVTFLSEDDRRELRLTCYVCSQVNHLHTMELLESGAPVCVGHSNEEKALMQPGPESRIVRKLSPINDLTPDPAYEKFLSRNMVKSIRKIARGEVEDGGSAASQQAIYEKLKASVDLEVGKWFDELASCWRDPVEASGKHPFRPSMDALFQVYLKDHELFLHHQDSVVLIAQYMNYLKHIWGAAIIAIVGMAARLTKHERENKLPRNEAAWNDLQMKMDHIHQLALGVPYLKTSRFQLALDDQKRYDAFAAATKSGVSTGVQPLMDYYRPWTTLADRPNKGEKASSTHIYNRAFPEWSDGSKKENVKLVVKEFEDDPQINPRNLKIPRLQDLPFPFRKDHYLTEELDYWEWIVDTFLQKYWTLDDLCDKKNPRTHEKESPMTVFLLLCIQWLRSGGGFDPFIAFELTMWQLDPCSFSLGRLGHVDPGSDMWSGFTTPFPTSSSQWIAGDQTMGFQLRFVNLAWSDYPKEYHDLIFEDMCGYAEGSNFLPKPSAMEAVSIPKQTEFSKRLRRRRGELLAVDLDSVSMSTTEEPTGDGAILEEDEDEDGLLELEFDHEFAPGTGPDEVEEQASEVPLSNATGITPAAGTPGQVTGQQQPSTASTSSHRNMPNLGQTCYASTGIQTLFSMPIFKEIVLEPKSIIAKPDRESGRRAQDFITGADMQGLSSDPVQIASVSDKHTARCTTMIAQLRHIFARLNGNGEGNITRSEMQSFVKSVTHLDPEYTAHHANDSHAFLETIVEALVKVTDDSSPHAARDDAVIHDLHLASLDRLMRYHKAGRETTAQGLFEIQLAKERECPTCHLVVRNFEDERFLRLNIPEDASPDSVYTIHQLLDQHRDIKLSEDNGINCPADGSHSKALSQTCRITTVSQTLVISFGRQNLFGQQMSNEIIVPEYLDLHPYTDGVELPSERNPDHGRKDFRLYRIFRLQAITFWRGSHYVTCNLREGEWMCFDDMVSAPSSKHPQTLVNQDWVPTYVVYAHQKGLDSLPLVDGKASSGFTLQKGQAVPGEETSDDSSSDSSEGEGLPSNPTDAGPTLDPADHAPGLGVPSADTSKTVDSSAGKDGAEKKSDEPKTLQDQVAALQKEIGGLQNENRERRRENSELQKENSELRKALQDEVAARQELSKAFERFCREQKREKLTAELAALKENDESLIADRERLAEKDKAIVAQRDVLAQSMAAKKAALEELGEPDSVMSG